MMKSLVLALIASIVLAINEESGARILTKLDEFREQLDDSQEKRFTQVLRQKEAPFVSDAPRAKWLPVEVQHYT